ncbi:SDR family NAD(P)-dependent oxidoreductase [Peredibacter starrii]|uniref:SDR family NAD(P)-dependent oxidoreductase n=1 Tax=Peredibacter starrii TaxID=28202 RepID=A0AAX4HPM2_9BACT|nr:SDR family NAD(P)-dependent oxidoreductase [Peredibacter starrii]WPU65058.1 SDR family NAD(P)-dependent oxidoreductase [Peredibacter starrii]
MRKTTLLIGNTDGIGAEMTCELLGQGHQVIGISRSPSKISHPNYSHIQLDVAALNFRTNLSECLQSISKLDLCIYLAGIGQELNLSDLRSETKVFEVNLMGAVIATELVLEKMQTQNSGHFIGISSLGDMLISPESPSYTASKIGLSRYWEGLGLALKKKKSPLKITNVRFGFVDTKMAKAPVRPLQISRKEAVMFLQDVIERPRIRASKPKLMIPLVGMVGLAAKLKVMFE